jgi:hypothetical protein
VLLISLRLLSYHNTSQPNASASANKDPANVSGGGAFGAFVTTNSILVLSVYVDATPLELVVTNAPNAPPPDTFAGSLLALADAFG